MKNLIYLFNFDFNGQNKSRELAKIAVSSIQRSYSNFDIVVFTNSQIPLFILPRSGYREIYVSHSATDIESLHVFAQNFFFEAHNFIPDGYYCSITYMDIKSIVLRNIDHLFDFPTASIISSTCSGRKLMNQIEYLSQMWSFTGNIFHSFWKEINIFKSSRIHSSCADLWWSFLNERSDFLRYFESREICYPFLTYENWQFNHTAAVINTEGIDPKKRLKYMYGIYMQTYFFDERLTLLSYIDN